jgi:dTMP kinase
MTNNKPLWVVFEGIDGSGKTTLINNVYNILCDKYNVLCTKEPGCPFDPFTVTARNILKSDTYQLCDKAELFLFLADRAQHYNYLFGSDKPHSNDVILQDRGYWSTIAYQGRQNCNTVNFIRKAHDLIFDRYPDIIVWCDAPLDVAIARLKQRGNLDTFETVERLKQVSKIYEDLFNQTNIKHYRVDMTQNPTSIASNVSNFIININNQK